MDCHREILSDSPVSPRVLSVLTGLLLTVSWSQPSLQDRVALVSTSHPRLLGVNIESLAILAVVQTCLGPALLQTCEMSSQAVLFRLHTLPKLGCILIRFTPTLLGFTSVLPRIAFTPVKADDRGQ